MAEGFEIVRFLHTSDWHLGLSHISLRDSAGIPIEYRWVQRSAHQLVDYTVKHGIGLLLMCGDILQSNKPTPTVENMLGEILHRLTENGTKVIYLLGNHEIPGWGDHPAKIYETLDVEGVIIADDVSVHKIDTEHCTVQIATVPYCTMSGVDGNFFEDAVSRITDELEPELPSILMAHIFVDGAKTSGSDIKLLPNEPHISPTVLHQLPFHYIALGHIHRYQQVSPKPPALYCGSIQRVSFAEESEKKGFLDVKIIRTEDRFKTEWHFLPIDATKFLTIDVDVSGECNPIEIAERKLSAAPIGNAMVRMRIFRLPGDPKMQFGTLRRKAKQLGAISIRFEEKYKHRKSAQKLAEEIPTGDMLSDVEKYIALKRPELKTKTDEILKTIKDLLNGK